MHLKTFQMDLLTLRMENIKRSKWNNAKQIIQKHIKFKNDEGLLIEKIDIMKDKIKRLGLKVPQKLVSK